MSSISDHSVRVYFWALCFIGLYLTCFTDEKGKAQRGPRIWPRSCGQWCLGWGLVEGCPGPCLFVQRWVHRVPIGPSHSSHQVPLQASCAGPSPGSYRFRLASSNEVSLKLSSNNAQKHRGKCLPQEPRKGKFQGKADSLLRAWGGSGGAGEGEH